MVQFNKLGRRRSGYRTVCKNCANRDEREARARLKARNDAIDATGKTVWQELGLASEKKCSRCKQIKSRYEFHKALHRWDGQHGMCHNCTLETSSDWYEENKDKKHTTGRQWRASNPDKMRAYSQKRRAGVQSYGSEQILIEEVIKRDGPECCYCGAITELDPKTRHEYRALHAELEHLHSIFFGGPHTLDNLAVSCAQCNRQKGARTVSEFIARQKRLHRRIELNSTIKGYLLQPVSLPVVLEQPGDPNCTDMPTAHSEPR